MMGWRVEQVKMKHEDDGLEGQIVLQRPAQLAVAGKAADRAAASGVFAAFQSRKAAHTRRRHVADLRLLPVLSRPSWCYDR
jgi:hypothetical protein